jgi:uncharacterized protein YlxP (DUF503 family)
VLFHASALTPIQAGLQPNPDSMTIGLLTIELYLPLVASLKEKRGIIKPVIARIRREFNVSVCEADAQDEWTRAVLAVVCVSHDGAQAHRHLQLVANLVEGWRLDAQLVDYEIEMLA